MITTPKDIIKRTVVLAIYKSLPRDIEVLYDELDGVKAMADCGPISLEHTDIYPNKYLESSPDKCWLQDFSKHVAKWFWNTHPLPKEHEFFLAEVEITDEYFVKVTWGTR